MGYWIEVFPTGVPKGLVGEFGKPGGLNSPSENFFGEFPDILGLGFTPPRVFREKFTPWGGIIWGGGISPWGLFFPGDHPFFKPGPSLFFSRPDVTVAPFQWGAPFGR